MNMLNFADTQEKVSALALGCLPFGTKVDKDSAFAQLDYYYEKGGNFLDTANNYSFWEPNGKGGESEAVLADWMKERRTRDRVFLATKLGAKPTVGRDAFFSYEGNPWVDLTEGLSRKTVLQAVDASLERLGTDRIDLLYAHVDDRCAAQEETLEALNDVVKAGKVRYIGCSNFKVWRLARAREISRSRGWAEYKAVQMFHTYFQSEKNAATGMSDQMGDELFDYVRECGSALECGAVCADSCCGSDAYGSADSYGGALALLGYTPLLWGSYSRPEKYGEIDKLKAFVRPQNDERRVRLARVASETGWSVNQVIYAWMLSCDPVVIPLVSATKLEHLKEDLCAADLKLSAAHLALLNMPLN